MDASNARTRHIRGLAGIAAALLASSAMGPAPLPANQYAWGDEPTFQQVAEDQDASFTPVEPSAGPSDYPNTTSPAPLPVYPADAQVAGCVTVAAPGTFYDTETRALLDRVNQIRAEAAAEGLAVDGQAVSGAPLAWSDGLAYAAQVRAVETALFGSENGGRPNGTGAVTTTDPANPFSALGISLETAGDGMTATDCLDAWYAEKQAYLDYLATGVATGEFAHYQALIADGSDFLGLGCFAIDGSNTVTLVLERATLPAASGTERPDGQAVQQICVAPEMLDARIEVASGSTAAKVGDALQLTVRVTPAIADPNSIETPAEPNGSEDALLPDSMDTAETVIDLTPYIALEWGSNNPEVAAVDAFGQVNILAAGAATIAVGQSDVLLASMEITVEAAPAQITGVEQPAGVSTASGVAPELPATVRAVWSDGSATDEAVSWDAVDPALYSDPLGGTFAATGWVAGWDEPVSCQVTVEAAPASITSVEQPAGVATANGVAPALPATVRAVWSNGSATDEAVSWDAVDPALYFSRAGGTFSVTGQVAGWSEPVSCQIEVAAAIASAEPLGVETIAGVAPTLPQSVSIVWSNGDRVTAPAAWNTVDPASYAAPGSFTATGIANLDGTALDIACTVSVESPDAVSATAPQPVTTLAGVAPELPQTTQVTWSNGLQTDAAIQWGDIDPALYAAAGSFTVSGMVEDTSLTVDLTVNVQNARIVSVGAVTLTTPAGIAPSLPAYVEATWENSSVTSEAVRWQSVNAASYATQGSVFTVAGLLAVDGVTPVEATVTVEAPQAVSAHAIGAIVTTAGTAPQLPTTIPVTLSDGSIVDAPITWNALDATSYQSAGQFVIEGTAQGLTVSATVTVLAPKATGVQNATVSTTVGAAPALPETLQVTWSNGTTSNEPVTWQVYSSALCQKAGTFRITGTAAGLQASAVVTVNPASTVADQPQNTPTDQPAGTPGTAASDNPGTSSNTSAPNAEGISATADANIELAIIIGSALTGLAAICAGVVLTLKERRSRL